LIKIILKINGIAYRDNDKIIINKPEKVVPNERMDLDLPGYAWDLLPYKKNLLIYIELQCGMQNMMMTKEVPYAALHSSLGCQFKCSFCMINLINRNDNDEIGVSSQL
jgi:anaerobic magnesium-protoporphyrin IX monomethyl ester cyclase